MSVTLDAWQAPEAPKPPNREEFGPRSLEGRLQRVNYAQGEFTVVAEGKVWHFALASDCELWFQGKPVPFRCFHPLDRIRVVYRHRNGRALAQALYVWEFFP